MGPKRWARDTHVNTHKGLNRELQGHLEDKEFLVLQEDARWWKGRGDGAAHISEREFQNLMRPAEGGGAKS